MSRTVTKPAEPTAATAAAPASAAAGADPASLHVARMEDVAVIVVPRAEGRRAAAPWSEVAQAAAGESRLVIDLRHHLTLDRQSLGGLIRCLRRIRSRGGDVALCSLNNQVLALLELTGVPYLTLISETPESAVRLVVGDVAP